MEPRRVFFQQRIERIIRIERFERIARIVTQKELTYDDLLITFADVYEQMGYHGALPDEATQRETQAVVDDVRQWLHPQFCFFVIRELPDFDMGKIILRQLRGSEAYALFVCTAGVDYESYQQRLGKTTEEMVQEMRPLATRRIQLRLVLSAIAEAENITVSDEEVEAHWDTLAQQYGIDKARLKVYMGEVDEEIRAELQNSKAYALLRQETILEMA